MRCLGAKKMRWTQRCVLNCAKNDGSEFPGCKGGVDDLLIMLLSFCSG